MNLVGLVVAGQAVHHDVHAGPEREFALARLARHHRVEKLAGVIGRPGPGEVVAGDEDGRYAVARADRADVAALGRRLVLGARARLDPERAADVAAGKSVIR